MYARCQGVVWNATLTGKRGRVQKVLQARRAQREADKALRAQAMTRKREAAQVAQERTAPADFRKLLAHPRAGRGGRTASRAASPTRTGRSRSATCA